MMLFSNSKFTLPFILLAVLNFIDAGNHALVTTIIQNALAHSDAFFLLYQPWNQPSISIGIYELFALKGAVLILLLVCLRLLPPTSWLYTKTPFVLWVINVYLIVSIINNWIWFYQVW